MNLVQLSFPFAKHRKVLEAVTVAVDSDFCKKNTKLEDTVVDAWKESLLALDSGIENGVNRYFTNGKIEDVLVELQVKKTAIVEEYTKCITIQGIDNSTSDLLTSYKEILVKLPETSEQDTVLEKNTVLEVGMSKLDMNKECRTKECKKTRQQDHGLLILSTFIRQRNEIDLHLRKGKICNANTLDLEDRLLLERLVVHDEFLQSLDFIRKEIDRNISEERDSADSCAVQSYLGWEDCIQRIRCIIYGFDYAKIKYKQFEQELNKPDFSNEKLDIHENWIRKFFKKLGEWMESSEKYVQKHPVEKTDPFQSRYRHLTRCYLSYAGSLKVLFCDEMDALLKHISEMAQSSM